MRMHASVATLLASLSTAAALLLWACTNTNGTPGSSGGGAASSSGYLFVNGTVLAALPADSERSSGGTLRQIALPNASVFLVPLGDAAHPLAATQSDLSGRFILKTLKRGAFWICVRAPGFSGGDSNGCLQTTVTLNTANVRFGDAVLTPIRDKTHAAFYGSLRLRDGTLPRGFFPVHGLNAYAAASLHDSGGVQLAQAPLNAYGEYVIPQAPIQQKFSLRFAIDHSTLDRDYDPLSKLLPGHAYEISATFDNHAPHLRAVTLTDLAGKRLQFAAPGSKVLLHALGDDIDGDKLAYYWLLPDGSTQGPSPDNTLQWTVPNHKQRYEFSVVVGDGRGGYARDGVGVDAASTRAIFSGSIVDTAGAALGGAQIEVNGRLSSSNALGQFSLNVPPAERYVMTIRKPGLDAPGQPSYGTASYVYGAAIAGGRWTLRGAMVSTVDPTHAISLQQTQRDCPGPEASRIDWPPYLQANLFDWQDGRGHSLALADLSADKKAQARAQALLPLLTRINPGLAQTWARALHVQPKTDVPTLRCGPGIRVDIPANALVDRSSGLPPSGLVQLSLASIALSTGEQMPGDYTARDSGGKVVSMESYGAGSVEIGSAGKRYNLKDGSPAEVTIPVDATQWGGGATPPANIPLLHYDESSGLWRQEGSATLSGSGSSAVYRAKVAHFSTINADILKTGQSCVAVEVGASLAGAMPFHVEVVMQPSQVNPGVIQVRQDLVVDSLRSNAIYNLPNNTDIVLTPIISGTLPDGDPANVPAGVFVVNTGGPQVGGPGAPTANADGSYYAESGGVATGPCAARVTLQTLNPPVLLAPDEFLQGLSFQSSNLTELAGSDPAVATAIQNGAVDYYHQADPRDLRASFNLFKSKNHFGEALGADEIEENAQYANSGDLGFGRNMHCRRNHASDGQFDYACYVTNFGQPPIFQADQQDAEDTGDPSKADATVAMEFSRVENAAGDANEFADDVRAVKFYVYDTQNPDSTTRILQADLDGHGARPVPQLCMICHGGTLASIAADPMNPLGPKIGAFADATDIKSMRANFLPFDLHFYHFPAAHDKTAQQPAFKTLNTEIVDGVSAATGTGDAIVEAIDTAFYAGGSLSQLEDHVVAGWDPGNVNSNPHKLYQNVVARACRTCHIARPFNAPPLNTQASFDGLIASVQDKACTRKIMPHAQRTNDIFWQSLNPNMPAFLELYGQSLPDWASAPAAQCGLFYQPGTTAVSTFAGKILPILQTRCGGCHGSAGLANFGVNQSAATVYNALLNNLSVATMAHYIVANNSGNSLLYQRISSNALGTRMPQGQAPLDTVDLDSNGVNDQQEILNWINSGAPGP